MNKNLSKEDIQDLEKEIPLNRIGKPEDIAKVVKLLIQNEYITGQVITVDGRMDRINKNNFTLVKLFLFINHCLLFFFYNFQI